MDNSSTNPHIPQESEAIRNKVYQQQSPFAKLAKLSLIVTAVFAVLVGIGLFFVIPMTASDDEAARLALANVLQPTDQISKDVPVVSDLGFSLRYDNQRFTGEARVQAPSETTATKTLGASYDGSDLRTKRNYAFVAITPIESTDSSRSMVTLPPQLQLSAELSLNDLKEAMKAPELSELSQLSAFVRLQTDIRLAKKVADDKTVVTIEDSKPVSQTINDIQYQKVRYTTTNDNYRIANELYEDCYYTIQHGQPYTACVTDVRPNNLKAAALVEQVLQTVSYAKPAIEVSELESTTEEAKKDDKTAEPVSRTDSSIVTLAQATAPSDKKQDDKKDSTEKKPVDEEPKQQEEAALVVKEAEYNKNVESLRSIAATQPSVVRIGTIYCADVALKLNDGATVTTLTDACVGGVNSGVIISSDGYVATTGHAIRYDVKEVINGYINFAESRTEMFDRLERVLDYLVRAKILQQSDADYLKNGAGTGDQEALAKIENLTASIPDNFVSATNEEYSYSVQPSDKPIVVNRTSASKPSFAYSGSVLPAKFVLANYDAKKSLKSKFNDPNSANDTGLLKMEGTFQNISVTAGAVVKSDSILNTIGFPAYTDSSLAIDKIRNTPVVTKGVVGQIYNDKLLIQTNAPAVPGNDGAPVVDQAGALVGLSVYGSLYCPDQLCFASGTVRSTSELLVMLNKKNISLGSASEATKLWKSAIDDYLKGNYSAAASKFAANTYSYNTNASKLHALASEKKGSNSDTSLANQGLGVLIWSLVALIAVSVLSGVAYIVHRRRIDSLQVGHYGVQPVMSAPTAGAGVHAVAPALKATPQPVPVQQAYAPMEIAAAQSAPSPLAAYDAPAVPVASQQPSAPEHDWSQAYARQQPTPVVPSVYNNPAYAPQPPQSAQAPQQPPVDATPQPATIAPQQPAVSQAPVNPQPPTEDPFYR